MVRGRRAGSVGAQSALGRRAATDEVLRTVLGHLADRVATRLRAARRAGRTVTVRVRFAGLRAVTRSATLPRPVSATLTLADVAVELARAALDDHPGEREVSLLAVSVANLVPEPALQLELPLGLPDEARRSGTPAGSARGAVDRAVDGVRARFGRDAVGFAGVVLRRRARGAGRLPGAR